MSSLIRYIRGTTLSLIGLTQTNKINHLSHASPLQVSKMGLSSPLARPYRYTAIAGKKIEGPPEADPPVTADPPTADPRPDKVDEAALLAPHLI